MVIIQDYINFPNDFDEFPEMRDLSAEEQEYINQNGVTAFLNETKYTNKTATITFNGVKQVISKVFLSSYHINWIVNMLKNLYNAVQGMFLNKGTYSSSTTYSKGNIVRYNNIDYLCINDCKGIAVSNTAYWARVSGKDGINGIDGENSVFYYLSCPYQAITRTSSTVYNPSNITVTANCLNGTILSNPNCRFRLSIKEINNTDWIFKANSGLVSESNFSILSVITDKTEAIKIGMYDSNNNLLDEKVINVLDMSPYPKTGYGNPIFYAECSSAANSSNKNIILDDYIKYVKNTGIYTGIPILVNFINGNSSINTNPMLTIYDSNGNEEIKTSGYDIISYNSSNGLLGTIKPYTICMLIYDGDNWQTINY